MNIDTNKMLFSPGPGLWGDNYEPLNEMDYTYDEPENSHRLQKRATKQEYLTAPPRMSPLKTKRQSNRKISFNAQEIDQKINLVFNISGKCREFMICNACTLSVQTSRIALENLDCRSPEECESNQE